MVDFNYDLDNLYSLDQFTTGLIFQFPRVLEGERWNKWYRGEYETLMPAPSVDNGYKLFSANDLITYPYFMVASDFYVDATWAETPNVSGLSGNRGQEWLAQNAERVFQIFRRATLDWAIHGRGIVIVNEDGTLVNVDPTNYFRIGQIWERDDLVAHAICYRYYDGPVQQHLPAYFFYPNRIRIIKYYPEMGINSVQTFAYSGVSVGQALTPEMPAGIAAICTFGIGDSWYGGIERLMARYLIQLTTNHATLNWAVNSPVTIPRRMLTSDQVNDTRSFQQKMDDFRQQVRPIIGLDEDSREPTKLQGAPEYPHQRDHLEMLGLLISQVSKVPPTSFGIGIGAGESGYARERSQDAAAVRIKDIRNRIAKCLPDIVKIMGAPAGNYSFSWGTSPFEDKLAKQNELITLKEAGILTVNEVRTALGYSEIAGGTLEEGGNDE